MSARPRGAWDLTLRVRGETVRVRVGADGIAVDPPEARDDPFVAAALAEIARTTTRPRMRPACARDAEPWRTVP